MECVVLFTIDDLFTMDVIWWGWEKNPEKYKKQIWKPRKNSLFGCPPIPLSMKWRLTVFQCPKTPKTSWTYPWWERDPSLVGQKIQGWAWCGQLKVDNMIFIHGNFQDLQQNGLGWGSKNNGDGEDLGV